MSFNFDNRILIIGNGASRKGIDLASYASEYFVTFGCNKIFEEFTPNYLVVMDKEPITLAMQHFESNYTWNNIIIPSPFEKKKVNGSNSGAFCLKYADMQFPNSNIDILGFDSVFYDEDNGQNMYKYNKADFNIRNKLVEMNVFLTSFVSIIGNFTQKNKEVNFLIQKSKKDKLSNYFIKAFSNLETKVYVTFITDKGKVLEKKELTEIYDNHIRQTGWSYHEKRLSGQQVWF